MLNATTTAECPFCEHISDNKFTATSVHSIVRFEPLNPVTEGHMLFVPRNHFEWWYADVHLMAADAMQAATFYARNNAPDLPDYNIITSNGSSATQTIPHIHIHYVPRHADDGLYLPWTETKIGVDFVPTGLRMAADVVEEHLNTKPQPVPEPAAPTPTNFAELAHAAEAMTELIRTIGDTLPGINKADNT